MTYKIISTETFGKQLKRVDMKSRRIIYDKIQLIKENPYRYKRIHSQTSSKVFRVRLEIRSKQMRLIYRIIDPNVILVCLLERKKGYKDLEKYLGRVR